MTTCSFSVVAPHTHTDLELMHREHQTLEAAKIFAVNHVADGAKIQIQKTNAMGEVVERYDYYVVADRRYRVGRRLDFIGG